MNVGDEIELAIDKLAFGGEGVGYILIDGKKLIIFVEETVPGDVIIVRIGSKKRNFARGYVKKIVTPSPLRIAPRCRHFGGNISVNALETPLNANEVSTFEKGCGGCFWQFLDIANQLKIKEQHVRDALQRIGGVNNNVVLPIIRGEPWFYRNKLEFSFSKSLDNGIIGLGLHLRRRHHDVVELTECFLLAPFIGDLVQKVRQFFRDFFGALPAARAEDDLVLKSFTVRIGKNTGQMMLILSAENGQPIFLPQFKEEILAYCKEKHLELTSLYFIHEINQKGNPKRYNEQLLYGHPVIKEELYLPDGQKLCFKISPLAFFQTNTKQTEKLYSAVLAAASLKSNEIVFDLYCGIGTISLFCAKEAKKVYGIELNTDAIKNARENAVLNEINNVEFFAGDVAKILPFLSQKPDIIIVDPPRSGLAPKVIESITALKPKKLVYVSCNPASLARDAKLLIQAGFTLKTVQPIDMFPQTYHIEAVATFIAAY